MNFSRKNLVGIILIVVGTVIGLTVKVPIAVIGAIVTVVAGATISIAEQMKKTSLVGWKKYVFLIATIGGTVLLTLGGYSDTVIIQIVGAVVLIASIIFGVVVDKTTKKE